MLHSLLSLSKNSQPPPPTTVNETNCCGERKASPPRGVEALPRMWELFRILYDHHQAVEDKFILPALACPEAPQVAEDHAAFSALLAELSVLSEEKNFDGFHEKLTVFGKRYVQHTQMEEATMVVKAQALPDDVRRRISQSSASYFKAVPNGAWMLLSMRDIAGVTGDEAIWKGSLSWFVRTVVAGVFLSFDATYAEYAQLFPLPLRENVWLDDLGKLLQ